MALVLTDSALYPSPFSVGTQKYQLVTYAVASGDTTATVTASRLYDIDHVIVGDGAMVCSAATTYSTNTFTMTFTVPTATAATLTKGGVTYTAVAVNNTGNAITVTYTTGGTAGSELVTVVGSAITVQLQTGVSTITQVRTAVNASGTAAALVTATGTSGTAVVAAAVTSLTGGVTGGGAGCMILIGK